MKPLALATTVLSFVVIAFGAEKSNKSDQLTSKNALPSTFSPPQVFKNVNLVHIINLEKGYPKEIVNVVIENIASSPQDEYFIPFTAEQMQRIGGLEVRDRKVPELGVFAVDVAEVDSQRYIYFGITKS
jgi:oligosaccharyltransferase complex subunit alpha (ribophorin I)